jgi:hypothetical protein
MAKQQSTADATPFQFVLYSHVPYFTAKYLAAMALPRLFIKQTESTEPPWYVIRTPGGVEGGELRGSFLSRLEQRSVICLN